MAISSSPLAQTLFICDFASDMPALAAIANDGSTLWCKEDEMFYILDNGVFVLISFAGGGVPLSRLINTTAPLAGGGDLTADRTLTIADATTTAKGAVELATDGESAANVAVQGNDARMSNARTPTAHASSHQPGGGDAMAVDAAAATGSLRTIGTGALTAAAGNDARLSDARTPTAHATSHVTGGTDVIANAVAAGNAGLMTGADKTKIDSIAAGAEVNVNADWNAGSGDAQILNKPATFAPSAHAASHQNNGGDEISVAGLSGLLADGQTPLAHATSHKAGGSDAIKLDELAAPTDITTLNASVSAHGLLQKLPGGTSLFLRADGAFAAPPGGSVNIKETEIDVGTTPVSEATIAVTDVDVSASSKILGGIAYKAPTGKDIDELSMDSFDLKFEPGAGTFNAWIKGLEGFIADKFVIWYTIG